ncbi:hypothetical protein ACFOSD_09435 [Salinispirillum marinum]|uniref:HEPN AbiU2-like domain-containing protein n=2 Tax=Saccharospirillaceae TaxID=255527 RepID=A0ABV8BGZ0_9GAMM
MEETAKKLFEAIRGMSAPDPTIRVFVISENHFFRIYDGRYSWTEYSNEFGYADVEKLDRGKILSAFAKLEFLVTECLNLHILSASSSKYDDQAFLARKLPFRQRIEALKEFALINASLEKKLKNLAVTRNFLAHEWDEKMAKFDGGRLDDPVIFDKFARHLKMVFELLVDEYKRLQLETNYERYLLAITQQVEISCQSEGEP